MNKTLGGIAFVLGLVSGCGSPGDDFVDSAIAPDAFAIDAGHDAASVDATSSDAHVVDAHAPDTSTMDANLDAGTADAGALDANLDADVDASFGPVTGTAIFTYLTATGAMNVPQDITGLAEAVVVDASGTATTIPVVGAADGTFTIAVPGTVASYFFHLLPLDRWVLTSSRVLDVGSDFAGRADVMPPTMPTNVSLNATGLAAWTDADAIEIFSPDTGGLFSSAYGPWAGGDPANGDTMLSGALADWSDNGLPLTTGSDALYLWQLHAATSASGADYTMVARSYTGTAPTLVDGVDGRIPASGTAALTTPPTTISATLDFHATAFEALRSAVNPTAIAAAPGTNGLAIDIERSLTSHGLYGAAPDLLIYSVTTGAGATDANLGSVSIPNPFPSAWEAFLGVTWFDRVPYTLPGATSATRIRALNAVLEPLSAVTGAIVPRLSPPTAFHVNGTHDAFVDQTGVTTTPTLSWSAGTTGTPLYYLVHVYELMQAAGATQQSQGPTFQTTQTTLTIPMGVLETGHTYVVAIEAMGGSGGDAHPFRRPLPEYHATALSGILTP